MVIDFDIEGRPRKAPAHTTYTLDPSTGVIPPWATVGAGNAADAGVTYSFPTTGQPQLAVLSAAQVGTSIRRAAIFGPGINMALVLGVRVRVMLAAGSSATVYTPSFGLMTNPAIDPTARVEMVQLDSASTGPADINVLGAGITETKKSYERWAAAPAKTDLFLHFTPADCLVEMGRWGESDWAFVFGRNLTAQTLYPYVMLSTKQDTKTATLPLHNFQIDIDWK